MAGRIRIVTKSNHLPRIARVLPEAAGVIVERHGKRARDRARQLVPVDTGALQNTIEFEMTSQTEGALSAGGGAVDYSAYVEYGTARMAAQPYLRPAVADERAAFIEDFRRLEDLLR